MRDVADAVDPPATPPGGAFLSWEDWTREDGFARRVRLRDRVALALSPERLPPR